FAPPPLHVPTITPYGTNACNAESRSTGKKPPSLLPHPLGFVGTLPRICPENPRGIGHKARDNPTIRNWEFRELFCFIASSYRGTFVRRRNGADTEQSVPDISPIRI
ncbi:hypothetical protein, partial [uncultured Bacteroides sp.]|uniref:hypothetical protein n=1 Tax=uncultured Bacteroides sp. TaxID=162156 RepID=UPI0026074BE0